MFDTWHWKLFLFRTHGLRPLYNNITGPVDTPAMAIPFRSIKRRNYGGIIKKGSAGAAAFASNALAHWARFRSQGSATQTKRRKTTSGTTSFQRDAKTLYRRRGASRRVRRRARRSFQRFTYNLDRVQGMKNWTISYHNSVAPTPVAGDGAYRNCQGVDAYVMYGTDQSVAHTDHCSDLSKIYLSDVGSVLGSTSPAAHFRFRSCIMDFQVKNTHETNACYIEVYHVLCRKDSNRTSNPGTCWVQSAGQMVDMGGNTIVPQTSGYKVTPFDTPTFGSYWKILKRTRYYVEPGNSVSWQLRDAKNYLITSAQIYDSFGLPGITEGCIIVGYGADSEAATNTGEGIPSPATYDIGLVTTYHYTRTDSNTDTTGYYNS